MTWPQITELLDVANISTPRPVNGTLDASAERDHNVSSGARHGPPPGLTCMGLSSAWPLVPSPPPPSEHAADSYTPRTLAAGFLILIFFGTFVVSICCIQCTGCFAGFSGVALPADVPGHPNWRQ